MNVAVPLAAVAVTGAVVLARPAARAEPDDRMVEMEVATVFELGDSHAGVLVLKQKGRELLLPIVVGTSEADVVSRRLKRQAPLRPRTHDLLEQTIGALGGRVVRVEIRDASEAVYRARIFLAHGSQRVELDARPSDSIALALGARAPIYAERTLVEGSGLSPEDLERIRGAHAAPAEPEETETAALPPEQRM